MAEPIELTAEGMIQIPCAPGLGVQWDPDGVAKFTGGLRLTPSVV